MMSALECNSSFCGVRQDSSAKVRPVLRCKCLTLSPRYVQVGTSGLPFRFCEADNRLGNVPGPVKYWCSYPCGQTIQRMLPSQVDQGLATACTFLTQRQLHLHGLWKAECSCVDRHWGRQMPPVHALVVPSSHQVCPLQPEGAILAAWPKQM